VHGARGTVSSHCSLAQAQPEEEVNGAAEELEIDQEALQALISEHVQNALFEVGAGLSDETQKW
jgi:hypothetical protein